MSALYNEYIIASNNSINDNMYNAKKAAKSPSHRIKKILKPLLRMLKQNRKQNNYHSSECECHHHHHQHHHYQQSKVAESEEFNFWSSPSADNSANEELESRIFSEIKSCDDDAAVYAYGENNECDLQPVTRDQQFIPVHFARTEAGTFFWTTMTKDVDCDLVQPPYCCSNFQQPELQYGDRWVQA